MALHVVNEARRCLNCRVPLCRTGCPIQTPIPQMIQAFLHESIESAGQMLFENNPLSIVCSLVCDHEKQCEGHCILGKKGMPVHISSIENYISDNYFDRLNPSPAPRNGLRAAIIGTGPAGITIAVLLAQRGYDITLFDSRPQIGGVMRYGIPDFRLPKTILDRYAVKLRQMGVQIRPNTTIGGALSVDALLRDGYQSVFIGTGVWRPRCLNIEGESLGNVHFAIDYLASPDSFLLGDSAAIIGAGNSAMDVARTAIRKGVRRVTVYARRDRLTVSKLEADYAVADGVIIEYLKSPLRITPQGPIMADMTLDESGRPHPIPGSERLIPADSTIIAIGQGPKDKIVSTTTGINVSDSGLVITNTHGETTRPGIFASGDVVLGARTVVEAVAYSKRVADQMDAYMQALPGESR